MAEDRESDSSYEHESQEYLNEIIRDVFDESLDVIPDSNDEFWKPVIKSEEKENGFSTDLKHSTVKDNLNSSDDEPNLILDKNCSCLNSSSDKLRRSKSDDILTPSKNHFDNCNLHEEIKSSTSSTTKRIQSESVSCTDDDDDDDENYLKSRSRKVVSFFDEYEKRIETLEYYDFVVEESMLHLHTKVMEIEDFFDSINKERLKGDDIDEPGNETQKDGNEHCDSEERDKNKEKELDESNEKDDEEMEEVINEIQMMFIAGLKHSLEEMQKQFENFVTEVGETVQLGSIAAKHSERVENWANRIQHLYVVIKEDQGKTQNYLVQKEKEWLQIKEHLELTFKDISKEMEHILECLKEADRLKTTGGGNSDNKDTKNSQKSDDRNVKPTEANLFENLQRKNYDQQQVIALDLNRQMKISELKLVVLRQQAYIQMLELQNMELDGILRGVLDNEKSATPYVLSKSLPVTEKVNTISEVLNCDKGMYLPGKTTHPEFVALQTFEIGGGFRRLPTDSKEIFDPRVLNYIKHDIEPETKDTGSNTENTENQASTQFQEKISIKAHGDGENIDIKNESDLLELKTNGDVGVDKSTQVYLTEKEQNTMNGKAHAFTEAGVNTDHVCCQ